MAWLCKVSRSFRLARAMAMASATVVANFPTPWISSLDSGVAFRRWRMQQFLLICHILPPFLRILATPGAAWKPNHPYLLNNFESQQVIFQIQSLQSIHEKSISFGFYKPAPVPDKQSWDSSFAAEVYGGLRWVPPASQA